MLIRDIYHMCGRVDRKGAEFFWVTNKYTYTQLRYYYYYYYYYCYYYYY